MTLFPPSLRLSPALCLYLGAVRAPLLEFLLKREHIQWGLSQSYSVSIKEPGNTTLSGEALLKGQRDSGLSNLSPSASHLFFHGKQSTWKEENKRGIYAGNQFLMNGARTLRGLHPDSESQHHFTSQTTTAQYQLLLLSPDGNQWQTHLFRLQLMVRHCFGWACRLRSNRLGDIPLTQCWLCRITANNQGYVVFLNFSQAAYVKKKHYYNVAK